MKDPYKQVLTGFGDIPRAERQAVGQALLRYCELDTLAMVMIWEAWVERVGK